MERGEIYDQTFNLYETHCKGCTGWQEVATRRVHKAAEEYCNNVCPIGRKMRDLGDLILFGRPVRTARELIKEVYLQEKESGLLDKDICKKYEISSDNLHTRKEHWNLVQRKGDHFCTKENYLRYKDKGFTDAYIAKKLKVNPSTLRAYKKKWEIKVPKTSQTIDIGVNGEHINVQTYLEHKRNGLRQYQIAKKWGVDNSVITRRLRKWRKENPEIDFKNVGKCAEAVAR